MSDELDDFFTEALEAGGEESDQPDVESEVVSDADVVEEEADNLETETDEAQDAESETEEEASEETWDWEAHADQLVPVVVNGETQMVTLKEARDGFMMRSDYTRKTQELSEVQKAAQWAQDVQSAFNRDPEGTVIALAQAYGIDTGAKQNPIDDLDEDVRPWAERTMQAESNVSVMEQRLQQLELDRMKAEIQAEVHQLESRYEDFDAPAVLRLAASEQISLENAHLILSARAAQQTKQSTATASKVAAEAAQKVEQDVQAKRAKAKQDAVGASKKSFKSVEDIGADEFNTIDELFGLIAQSS